MQNKKYILYGILGIVFIMLISIGIYFYINKSGDLKICISNEITELNIQCSTNKECRIIIESILKTENKTLNDFPGVLKNEMNEIYNEIIFCDTTCKIKKTYSGNSCNPGDKEILIKASRKELSNNN